ncbi:hypothetical protein [Streptomyces huasconensis]|uniref:hypothetical protein n=1 Tax=Streptomyces huasconensis TaxID=1854574 RepID=UPI0037031D6F
MPAEIVWPVYVRVGDHPEAHFGDLALTATGADGGLRLDVTECRARFAEFLRAAADVLENPSEDAEEVPDAAADG